MSTELKVGAVVLIAIGVLAFFILQIEEGVFFRAEEGYEVRIVFDSIAGLAVDSEVRLAGVRVGRVTDIELTEDGQAEVAIRLRDPEIRLRQDAVASVASAGLLGEKYLELTAGSPGQEIVPSGGYIRSGPAVSIDQMVAVMNGIAADFRDTTESINNVFGTEAGEARMQRILDNLERMSAEAELMVAGNRDAVNATMGNVEDLTARLNETLPAVVDETRTLIADIDGLVEGNEERVGAALDELRSLLSSLDRSAATLEDIVGKVNRGDGTVGRLINEPETFDKVNNALDTIDDSLSSFDTFFNRVGQTQFSFSLRSEFYEQDRATKNYFGVRFGLGPAGDRGFILQLVDDNVGAPDVTEVTTEIFDADGDLAESTTERRTVRAQDFLVSALLAQRFGRLQLRGGLMESEVGGGIDLFAGDRDRWRFSAEAWDFGREPDPHLKFRVAYSILDRLFLTAGYDDLLSEELRQFYFGGGYQFR